MFHFQVKYDTIEYWHKIYAENMEKFFAIFDSLTDGVSIGMWIVMRGRWTYDKNVSGDINRLFSNYYLDSIFKPEWERYSLVL